MVASWRDIALVIYPSPPPTASLGDLRPGVGTCLKPLGEEHWRFGSAPPRGAVARYSDAGERTTGSLRPAACRELGRADRLDRLAGCVRRRTSPASDQPGVARFVSRRASAARRASVASLRRSFRCSSAWSPSGLVLRNEMRSISQPPQDDLRVAAVDAPANRGQDEDDQREDDQQSHHRSISLISKFSSVSSDIGYRRLVLKM